jgi:hypothetical protein
VSEKAPTFSDNINQTLLETPKPTNGVFELPCGYIDTLGVLHNEVHLREMTGREEDLLATPKLPVQKKLAMLISACMVRLGTITDKAQFPSIVGHLPTGDRIFLLLALRRTSLGDAFPVEEVCPECKSKGNYVLDISDLTVQKMTNPMVRVFDDVLPSGRKVRHRLGTGADEDRASKVADDDKPSAMLLARIELLDGKAPTMADIKELSFRDRQGMRTLMEKQDGGVDTEMDMQCPVCSHEYKSELDLSQAGFFFPGRAPKGSKAKSST